MPAAAVIPALIAYIKVVVLKSSSRMSGSGKLSAFGRTAGSGLSA